MSELVDFLDRTVDSQATGLLRSVDEIIVRGHLRAHIAMLLDSTSGVGLPSAAELHPNGFIKMRIALKPAKWSVRLHLWGEAHGESHIHSHRWDFASRVLHGILRTRTYHPHSFGDNQYAQFLCRRTPQGGYSFESAGTCDILQIGDAMCTTDHSYFQWHRSLHTVETASSSPVATVVVQGPDVSDNSMVIAKSGQEPPSRLALLPLEGSDVNAALKFFLDLLPE
jgi:hypothetical protein